MKVFDCAIAAGMALWALPAGAAEPPVIVGLGDGAAVSEYDSATGAEGSSFFAFSPAFTGGVRVALGDVNGDGVADIIAGAGPGGGPQVSVFDGSTHSLLNSFFAFTPTFTGGVYVAAGDINGDGYADIAVGADAGGAPQISLFNGLTGMSLGSFLPFSPTFTGGVRVALGDVNGDGRADIIAGAGPGGGPQVSVFDGSTLSLLNSFYAFTPTFTGGVYVAAGDINGDGRADIAAGAGSGGGPQINLFDGATGASLGGFLAFSPAFTGGVRVALGDVNGDGAADIIAGAGPGGLPQVTEFAGNGTLLGSYFGGSVEDHSGVFVAAAAVPEPAAPALTIAGLLALAAWGAARRRA